MAHPDITLWRDGSHWAFTPRTRKADDWLFYVFGWIIGESDIGTAEVAHICELAEAKGFTIEGLHHLFTH